MKLPREPLFWFVLAIAIGVALLFWQEHASAAAPVDLDPLAHAAGPTITVTSYNPEPRQTDSSPCVGASGRDLCRAAREGDRVVALSRDLLKHFNWHDKVRLV